MAGTGLRRHGSLLGAEASDRGRPSPPLSLPCRRRKSAARRARPWRAGPARPQCASGPLHLDRLQRRTQRRPEERLRRRAFRCSARVGVGVGSFERSRVRGHCFLVGETPEPGLGASVESHRGIEEQSLLRAPDGGLHRRRPHRRERPPRERPRGSIDPATAGAAFAAAAAFSSFFRISRVLVFFCAFL